MFVRNFRRFDITKCSYDAPHTELQGAIPKAVQQTELRSKVISIALLIIVLRRDSIAKIKLALLRYCDH